MPIILMRLLRKFVRLRTGLPPLVVIVFVFATSWPLMLLAEPSGNPITEPENYWWWFVVTAATVGYGDFYPESSWGHVIGVYVIVGGIVTLTTVFAQLAEIIEKTKGRRMQGAVTLDIEDHVVVLGYSPGRTPAHRRRTGRGWGPSDRARRVGRGRHAPDGGPRYRLRPW
ncbi:potassium channel family protein [Amycolatopsis sp. lyj-108]|uniref:potassium channel family protein n=1 Tax=Amycolatopsis sp. lyj-108 TaxID=2789286 RepID=UPI00397C71BA